MSNTPEKPADAGPIERRVRPLHWTDDRCKELDDMCRLLREVTSINSGSHCLDRIARCIELAEALQKTDFQTGRLSFWHFMQDLAIADRSRQSA